MKDRNRRLSTPLVVALLLLAVAFPSWGADSPWSAWSFLLGEWEGTGSGAPGAAKGSFTFALDLQDTILVRRNHNEIPGVDKVPGIVHDDLLVCYRDPAGKTRADYYDNEGHVIRYAVTTGADGRSWVFVSDVEPGQPGFRLTYSRKDDGTLGIRFEVAPPGHPKDFRIYLEGSAVKKGAAPAHP